MRAIFCSHNQNKVREVAKLFPGLELEMLARQAYVPEETGSTFVENARIKAVAGAELYPETWVIADDSGLEVDALNGAPGIYAARFAGKHGNDGANNKLLLKKLEDFPNPDQRTARFVCVLLAIAPDGTELIARGEVTGHIANEISPVKGFAYDRLFIPTGYTQTFSELGLDVKAQISHRARAASDLLGQIKKSLA